MKYIVTSASVKSRCHTLNEDCCFTAPRFIIVADGMGGENCGEVASKIAVDVVASTLNDGLAGDLPYDSAVQLSRNAIMKADDSIISYSTTHPGAFGMGTTILLIIQIGQELCIAWCGDSRCYVYNKKNGLHCLTKDHSYVQDLIDEDKITIEESYSHPDSNLITRYVGGGDKVCIPDFTSYQMRQGDILIACSDGLSGYCRDKDIEYCVCENADSSHLPRLLIDLALSYGSDDDITIVTMAYPNETSIFGWLKRKLSSK